MGTITITIHLQRLLLNASSTLFRIFQRREAELCEQLCAGSDEGTWLASYLLYQLMPIVIKRQQLLVSEMAAKALIDCQLVLAMTHYYVLIFSTW